MLLPIINCLWRVENPNWSLQQNGTSDYYMEVTLPSEVLTLHLNRESMRVRAQWQGKPITQDIRIEDFLNEYEIKKKD